MAHMQEIKFSSDYVHRLPAGAQQGVHALCTLVWPPELDDALGLEMTPEDARPERFIALAERQGRVVATAEGFRRTLVTERGELSVLALASVCTLPECRAQGLGQRVVQMVLRLVHEGRFPMALWQTGVPEFYRKLGAIEVSNRFVNRRHATQPDRDPFWDKHRMIYVPNGSREIWPEGTIDLNGPAY